MNLEDNPAGDVNSSADEPPAQVGSANSRSGPGASSAFDGEDPEGEDRTARATAAAAWKFHDFHRPALLPAETVHALDPLHRKYARAASAALSVLLRSRVQVGLERVAQSTYFQFVESLSNPTNLHLVYCHPYRLPFVLEISPDIFFPFLERLLGGKGAGTRTPARPSTRVEQSVSEFIAEKLLLVLGETWAAGPELRFDLAEVEHNPLLMQIVGPAEPALVLRFDLSLGLRSGAVHFAFPAKAFEPLFVRILEARRTGLEPEGADTARARVLQRVSGLEMTLSAEFPSLSFRLEDVLGLRPGDVVDTQMGRASEVSVLIDGRRVYRGVPANHDGKRAVKLTRPDGLGLA